MKRVGKLLCIALALLLFTGCASRQSEELSSVQLVDKNGLVETVSEGSRLGAFHKTDFLEPQPYQKVARVYKRNSEGKVVGKLTSYHSNGLLYQYLETAAGRAHGLYQEWYPTGALRIEAFVIEGVGDLTPEAQSSWMFDGKSRVFDEQGFLMAEMLYEKGSLEGESTYYHPNQTISKIIPYKKNKIEGEMKLFAPDGRLIGVTTYVKGKKEGPSLFEGNEMLPKREEEYEGGKLLSGKYWDFSGNLIHTIEKGFGIKPIFEQGVLKIEHEYREGLPWGEVKVYRESGQLESIHHIVDGQKEGKEVCYYAHSGELKPRLEVTWKEDEILGEVTSWYENGQMESSRTFLKNVKNGPSMAWYESGDLMMVEEYAEDKLVHGKYFKKGEDVPTTRVANGEGVATIFDKEGNFVRKIHYEKGLPIEG